MSFCLGKFSQTCSPLRFFSRIVKPMWLRHMDGEMSKGEKNQQESSWEKHEASITEMWPQTKKELNFPWTEMVIENVRDRWNHVVFLELSLDSRKRRGFQASSWVGPGKPNLPLELRGKAGGSARVTTGPKNAQTTLQMHSSHMLVK